MDTLSYYADYQHRAIVGLTQDLTSNANSEAEKFDQLFAFVKNRILFGFPPKWDLVKASETLVYGVGYCNTKSVLLQALCKQANIECNLRAGLIQSDIMKHIFPWWSFPFLPRAGNHCWVSVKLDGKWHEVDAYIIDQELFVGAKEALEYSDEDLGYGLAYLDRQSTGHWRDGFIQTNALVEDHGKWEDIAEYFASPYYKPVTGLMAALYPPSSRMWNSSVASIRESGVILERGRVVQPNLQPTE